MNTGSPFFDAFSLKKLVEENYPWATMTPTGAGGIPGGTMGGASGHIGSGRSSFHKSETFAFPVRLASDGGFDEPGFIESFRKLISDAIIASEATISSQGAPGPNAFYLEYSYEDIRGRIDVVGELTSYNYALKAKINETGAGVIRQSTLSPYVIKPHGDYYVIGFNEEQTREASSDLLEIGRQLVKDSVQRLGILISTQRPESVQYAEVFTFFRIPAALERALKKQRDNVNLEAVRPSWNRFQEYERILFLNETALRMYRDAGIELGILDKLSAGEMPERCHRSLRGPYIPLA